MALGVRWRELLYLGLFYYSGRESCVAACVFGHGPGVLWQPVCCLSVCTITWMCILLNKRDRGEERKMTRLEILGSDSLARKLEAGPWGL